MAVLNLATFVAAYDTPSPSETPAPMIRYHDITSLMGLGLGSGSGDLEEVTHSHPSRSTTHGTTTIVTPNTSTTEAGRTTTIAQYTSTTEASRVTAACNTKRANIAAGVVGGFIGGLVLGIVLTALFIAILLLITKQHHKKGKISRYNVMHYRYHNIIILSCYCVHACRLVSKLYFCMGEESAV